LAFMARVLLIVMKAIDVPDSTGGMLPVARL
jgi:hypothetical protein